MKEYKFCSENESQVFSLNFDDKMYWGELKTITKISKTRSCIINDQVFTDKKTELIDFLKEFDVPAEIIKEVKGDIGYGKRKN